MQVVQVLGLALLGYLVGSIPSGWLVVRLLRGRDLRVEGSGNIGTANVYRSAGALPAILTFLGDILKGAIPVLLGYLAGYPLGSLELALIGLTPVIGHTWPVFLRFRGGKGVATSGGVMLLLATPVVLVAVAVWAVIAKGTRYASLASLVSVAVGMVCLIALRFWYPFVSPSPVQWPTVALGAILVALVYLRHIKNIGRLLRGREIQLRRAPSNR